MANDTKERILDVALKMFSQNGYAGTNIRELSAYLGLVKSGIYKHYESKEATKVSPHNHSTKCWFSGAWGRSPQQAFCKMY